MIFYSNSLKEKTILKIEKLKKKFIYLLVATFRSLF